MHLWSWLIFALFVLMWSDFSSGKRGGGHSRGASSSRGSSVSRSTSSRGGRTNRGGSRGSSGSRLPSSAKGKQPSKGSRGGKRGGSTKDRGSSGSRSQSKGQGSKNVPGGRGTGRRGGGTKVRIPSESRGQSSKQGSRGAPGGFNSPVNKPKGSIGRKFAEMIGGMFGGAKYKTAYKKGSGVGSILSSKKVKAGIAAAVSRLVKYKAGKKILKGMSHLSQPMKYRQHNYYWGSAYYSQGVYRDATQYQLCLYHIEDDDDPFLRDVFFDDGRRAQALFYGCKRHDEYCCGMECCRFNSIETAPNQRNSPEDEVFSPEWVPSDGSEMDDVQNSTISWHNATMRNNSWWDNTTKIVVGDLNNSSLLEAAAENEEKLKGVELSSRTKIMSWLGEAAGTYIRHKSGKKVLKAPPDLDTPMMYGRRGYYWRAERILELPGTQLCVSTIEANDGPVWKDVFFENGAKAQFLYCACERNVEYCCGMECCLQVVVE